MMPDIALAARLFDALAAATRRGRGIERDTYGAGEQAAHDIASAAARDLGLAVEIDPAGNLLMTRPGRDRARPVVMLGSHLDSVPQGGNFDGSAGVLAGLAIAAALQSPGCDVTVMAVRGEESAWFDVPYIGSRAAFGDLPAAALSVRRLGHGRTLGEVFDDHVFHAWQSLDPARIACWLELHIEQGPVLVAAGLPCATVTGIRGCRRFRAASCHGAYGHSGADPRAHRADAVAATVALLSALESEWLAREKTEDLVFTVGELFTDPAMHGPSKVAGETRFVLDFRSLSDETMDAMADTARALAARIGAERRVRFDLGETSNSVPALMDATLRAALRDAGASFEMASGAGHDAAVFAAHGVPTGMIFVRNANGSHNPDEAMDISDFAHATEVLGRVVEGLVA